MDLEKMKLDQICQHCLASVARTPQVCLTIMYFCFGADSTDHILKTRQPNSTSVGFERRMFGSSFSDNPMHECQSIKSADPVQLRLTTMHDPPEGDQVVPSFQKLSVYEQCPSRRSSKPLPPLPDMGDLSSDEAADSEVEFFSSTSESHLLMSERAPKIPAFQCRVPNRRSFRGCGQVNYAYDGLHEQVKMTGQKCEREQVSPNLKQQERPQRKVRRSNSGPASSFKPSTLLNLQRQEKPKVPPRVPIPCRSRKSADRGPDEPPEIPPRQPIFHRVPCSPSPKSLPIYVNGVMPPTQSFAPNPKYVSKAPYRPNCEGLQAAQTPCILPIMEDGKQASATHYFLLPQRPGYLDQFKRFFKESDSEAVKSEF